MRILTWNVNVLRTCLDYHPFSSMKKKNVEGLLDELDAQIFCFQEHKTVRTRLEKSMACPGPYDGFWTFPRSKTGYSGVCTYVDSRYCVPFKAEEGITGLLLDDKGSTMKSPWTEEERIGQYPDADQMDWMDDHEGKPFEPRKLDMEGRAVVCDFGLFVLFNLYCPNETNETRRPYKMNFLRCLQERVRLLRQAGREVIIVGDMNIMRAPIDSGEGGIRTSAEQHYEHPARRILDDWCAPKGDMVDVVRENWPEREDMFTCWNQKLDARSANYGSRIDLILCTPGLRPWIKGGDILNKVYGSDHCPVYIDLHETTEHPTLGTLHLKDMLNPADRPLSTAPAYPNDVPRNAPEPPRFATKFFDEFSGKQTTLKSFFGGGGGASAKPPTSTAGKRNIEMPSPSSMSAPDSTGNHTKENPNDSVARPPLPTSRVNESSANPFNLARAAFDSIDSTDAGPSRSRRTSLKQNDQGVDVNVGSSSTLDQSADVNSAIDMTLDDDEVSTIEHLPPDNIDRASNRTQSPSVQKSKNGKSPSSGKNGTASASGASAGSQTKLSAFFAQPPSKGKRKTHYESPAITASSLHRSKSARLSAPPPPISPRQSQSQSSSQPRSHSLSYPGSQTAGDLPASPEALKSSTASDSDTGDGETQIASGFTEDEDAQILRAIAEAEEERKLKNEQAKPVWGHLFARKLPPLCVVHQKPCKDYLVMKPGPNKGKRFWLCSLPVGAGYDTGRAKRPREEVNHNFRCDFFLWDSANSRKESVASITPVSPLAPVSAEKD